MGWCYWGRKERSCGKLWTIKRNCCSKSRKMYTLWEKAVFVVHNLLVQLLCSIRYLCDQANFSQQMEKSKIKRTNWWATDLKGAAAFLLDTLLIANYSRARIRTPVSLPLPLIKTPQGKRGCSFYWPQSLMMLPFRTSGVQTSQKNSSC